MGIVHTVLNNKTQFYSEWLEDAIINLNDSTFVIPESFSYELLVVSEKYIARPDLLSRDIYGDAMYSDLLCKLNGISNPFELNQGMVLIIPSPAEIIDFMKKPSASDIEPTFSNTPIAKQKSEKRKPNEAILSDRRFKIDKTRGVVIY